MDPKQPHPGEKFFPSKAYLRELAEIFLQNNSRNTNVSNTKLEALGFALIMAQSESDKQDALAYWLAAKR